MIDVSQLCELGELALLASGWTPKTTARVTQTGIFDGLGTKRPHNVYLIHRFKTSRDNIGKYGFTVRPATTFRLEVKMLECSGRSSFKSLSMKSFSVRGCGRGDLLLKVSWVRRSLLLCVESSRRELSGMLVSSVPKSLQWKEGNRATAAIRSLIADLIVPAAHFMQVIRVQNDRRGKNTFGKMGDICNVLSRRLVLLNHLFSLVNPWDPSHFNLKRSPLSSVYLLCFQSLLVLQLLRPFKLFLLLLCVFTPYVSTLWGLSS